MENLPKPIRSGNKPDDWEKIALQSLENGTAEYSSVETIFDKPYLRLMIPLITEDQCLRYHASQDYRLNDIRGGISVSTPLIPLKEIAKSNLIAIITGHIIAWLTGLFGISVSVMSLHKRFNEWDLAISAFKSSKESAESLSDDLKK